MKKSKKFRIGNILLNIFGLGILVASVVLAFTLMLSPFSPIIFLASGIALAQVCSLGAKKMHKSELREVEREIEEEHHCSLDEFIRNKLNLEQQKTNDNQLSNDKQQQNQVAQRKNFDSSKSNDNEITF